RGPGAPHRPLHARGAARLRPGRGVGRASGGRGPRARRALRGGGQAPARRLHEARPRLRPPARAPLQLAHLALAARRADVRRAPRRAQGAWLRHLRGPGPARARDLPGRQHGAARARGLRALPRGARRGAGRVTAILLAAGVGKRLLGFSNGRPKCLIEGLAAAGVREAAVVVGFGEDAVRAAVGAGPHEIRVRCLSNPRFREGAILSLWTARELLDGPVLVMDADVLCPPAMIARLVRSPHRNCFLLDASVEVTGEEQMLLVRGERVLDIVRGGAPGYELAGESVGFLRLAAGA